MRLVAWNCHHGSIDGRLADLAGLAPDIVFLQECTPTVSSLPHRITRRVGPRKAVALASLNENHRLEALAPKRNSSRGAVAATVTGPVSFTALGIWARGPGYAADVMRTIKAYAKVLRSGPAVVMGDLNSGTHLHRKGSPSRGNDRIVAALEDLGLVSAYHVFHSVPHGHEPHATYRHLFKASEPWHIDFCFVPASWVDRLVSVEIADGEAWAGRSDHLPVVVDLDQEL